LADCIVEVLVKPLWSPFPPARRQAVEVPWMAYAQEWDGRSSLEESGTVAHGVVSNRAPNRWFHGKSILDLLPSWPDLESPQSAEHRRRIDAESGAEAVAEVGGIGKAGLQGCAGEAIAGIEADEGSHHPVPGPEPPVRQAGLLSEQMQKTGGRQAHQPRQFLLGKVAVGFARQQFGDAEDTGVDGRLQPFRTPQQPLQPSIQLAAFDPMTYALSQYPRIVSLK
jgi:hypothetical protein